MSGDKIYHGCAYVNEDGTRVLIDSKNDEQCLCPTNEPFWRQPKDCTETRIHIRNSTRSKKKGSIAYIVKYLNNLD